MSIPRFKRNWLKPTRRRIVLVAAVFGMLLLMASEPVPIIRYKGSIEPVSFEDVTTPIFQQFTPEGPRSTRLSSRLSSRKPGLL